MEAGYYMGGVHSWIMVAVSRCNMRCNARSGYTMNACKLLDGSGSWILLERATSTPKAEYFSKRNADKMARILAANPDANARYELLDAGIALGRFNRSIKDARTLHTVGAP